MAEQRLYDPAWWEETLDKGIPLTFPYSELPLEELLVCEEISRQHPGLRWNLRKQRGDRYLLTLLPTKDIDEAESRGAP